MATTNPRRSTSEPIQPCDILHGFFLACCLVQLGGWVASAVGGHWIKFVVLTGALGVSFVIWVFVFRAEPDPPSGDDDARDATVR